MPDFSNVFKPIVHHAHTEALPFSFERKYTKKAKMIDELVKKDDEEAAKVRSIIFLQVSSCIYFHLYIKTTHNDHARTRLVSYPAGHVLHTERPSGTLSPFSWHFCSRFCDHQSK